MAQDPGHPQVVEHSGSHPFFSFDVSTFLGDLGNVALDTCADGFDALERAVCAEEGVPEQDRALMQKAIDNLFNRSITSLDQSVLNFERLSALRSLHVPPELFLEQPCSSASALTCPEEERELDAELEQLQQKHSELRQHCLDLRTELRSLNRDLRQAGSGTQYQPMLASLSTSRETLLDNMAAIQGAVAKLQPLISAAEQLRAQGGGAQQEVVRYRDACEAERNVNQQMTDTGASLQQLQVLAQALHA